MTRNFANGLARLPTLLAFFAPSTRRKEVSLTLRAGVTETTRYPFSPRF